MNMQVKPARDANATRTKRGSLLFKRATDIVLSAGVLTAAFPFLCLIAIAIKLDSRGPILFKQQRVGTNGDLFEIWKFRTMKTDTPNVATDLLIKMGINPITNVGKFLRRSSLDELPQLMNVLRGEMSLVGPRPALFNQYELTEKRREAGVLAMPPGITGWAQVNGRDELDDDTKVKFDADYCNDWSYWLDWKIMVRTVTEVINRRGAN
jgi:O-antigen biosynthesis protein WbqP